MAVLNAGVQEWDGLRDICLVSAPVCPRVTAGWVDQGFTHGLEQVRHDHGWHLLVVRKPVDQKGFVVHARRWVVERTFAWLGHSRRLSKDYKRLPAVSEAMIYGAMSRLMLRRLTHIAA